MIAAAAFPKFARGAFEDYSLRAKANLALGSELRNSNGPK
jgi:hypothetical protein